jgi:hypothetical protein
VVGGWIEEGVLVAEDCDTMDRVNERREEALYTLSEQWPGYSVRHHLRIGTICYIDAALILGWGDEECLEAKTTRQYGKYTAEVRKAPHLSPLAHTADPRRCKFKPKAKDWHELEAGISSSLTDVSSNNNSCDALGQASGTERFR